MSMMPNHDVSEENATTCKPTNLRQYQQTPSMPTLMLMGRFFLEMMAQGFGFGFQKRGNDELK